MNQYQKEYADAKAAVLAIEEVTAEIERKYIISQEIVNPDMSIPERIYCIEDEEAFEHANQECSETIVSMGLEEEMNRAKTALTAAEDALIAYGLSIAPKELKETLSKGISSDYTIRCKMIEIVFRLDTSTVK